MDDFRTWATKARRSDSIAGDFMDDLAHDDNFPDVTTLAEVKAYLLSCRACDAAMKVAPDVWRRYQRYVFRAR